MNLLNYVDNLITYFKEQINYFKNEINTLIKESNNKINNTNLYEILDNEYLTILKEIELEQNLENNIDYL